jgi:PIN domain
VEYPIQHTTDESQVVSGWIDLLVKTEEGFILIDHKASSRSRSDWEDIAMGYSGSWTLVLPAAINKKEMFLQTNYVLIDFENVQPKNLDILGRHPFHVLVFVGANQNRVSFELANAMQSMGSAAEYVKISGIGPDAADFHIAYYIGELATKYPEAYFHIISKDKGFDPLIKHLKTKKIRVQREADLAEIPILKMSSATSNDERIEAIVNNLVGRGQSKPRKEKTLSNTINNLFTESLKDNDLQTLLRQLQQQGYIKIHEGNVTYKLPRSKS